MRVSQWAGLTKGQAELDFVDVDTRRDTRLFVDPYAIEIKDDAWSRECARHIRSFFETLLRELRAENDGRVEHLASHLHEPQETFLGLSKGRPQGRGVGAEQAARIVSALRRSRAFETGLLTDLGEAELFVEGIGPDKISDLTTNVLRGPLLSYTAEQAGLWGMPLTRTANVGSVWDPDAEDWRKDYRDVLLIEGRSVILVPKYSVRLRMSLDSQEFYNHHMINFLQNEYLQADRGLVRVLKSGERRVYKTDVKAVHPFSKSGLAEFAQQHPQILEHYKRIRGALGALEPEEMDGTFDERAYAGQLIVELSAIPPGNDAASDYHRFCLGALTFLFYPQLIRPVKEREVDQGRKRIDIAFTNAAQTGFFDTALRSNQMRAVEIPFECKNYSRDIANPELDQIEGRLTHVRGFLGFVCSRAFADKPRFIERCKDAAAHRSHYVMPLDDEDITAMLRSVQEGRRQGIDAILRQRHAEIVA